MSLVLAKEIGDCRGNSLDEKAVLWNDNELGFVFVALGHKLYSQVDKFLGFLKFER